MKMLVAVVCLLGSSSLLAAEESFVQVQSSGNVQVKPDLATITAYIIGQGETAAEATADHKSRLEAVNNSFDPMEFRDVEIKFGQVELNRIASSGIAPPVAVAPGGPALLPAADQSQAFHSFSKVDFQIKLGEEFSQEKVIELVDKIVSGIKKAELQWSRPGFSPYNPSATFLRFSVSDREALLDQAMEKAMSSARRKAELIAKLSGKKLGEVVSVTESGAAGLPGYSPATVVPPYSIYTQTSYSINQQVRSIPVVVSLQVKFALVD